MSFMRRRLYGFSFVFLLTAISVSYALGPHEIALLVNSNSAASIKVADNYAKLRGVPSVNIIKLNVPAVLLNVNRGITTNEFTKYIWKPANQKIGERGIDDHILAWIYSVDFPVMIKSKPSTSLTGITFMRNKLPDFNTINKGLYKSPLFAGPVNPNSPARLSESFDVSAQTLLDDMPLPCMMLGYIGERGNSVDDVINCLKRGVAADSTFPEGTVWFQDCADVRAKARRWQFARAKKELARLGVQSIITDKFPAGEKGIIGMLMGRATLKPATAEYRAGCMADNLTSFGAVFGNGSQMKITEWIKAGVTSSAGTIMEPYALWPKFPAAFFFVHYAKGCSMIESYYQSIRSPLQIFLIGEPLAAPWKPKAKLLLPGLRDGQTVDGKFKVRTEVKSEGHQFYSYFMLLIDGKVYSRGSSITFDSSKIKVGRHKMRVVAYLIGNIRSQIYKEIDVIVEK